MAWVTSNLPVDVAWPPHVIKQRVVNNHRTIEKINPINRSRMFGFTHCYLLVCITKNCICHKKDFETMNSVCPHIHQRCLLCLLSLQDVCEILRKYVTCFSTIKGTTGAYITVDINCHDKQH